MIALKSSDDGAISHADLRAHLERAFSESDMADKRVTET